MIMGNDNISVKFVSLTSFSMIFRYSFSGGVFIISSIKQLPSVEFIFTLHLLVSTAVILPTTTSPTSPIYL